MTVLEEIRKNVDDFDCAVSAVIGDTRRECPIVSKQGGRCYHDV